MDSDYTNRLIILLGTLLIYSSVLIDARKPDKPYHHKNEELCSIPPDDPDISTPEECYRECHVGEPPKICYYHFTLEYYTVLGGACELCTPAPNNSLTNDCQCVIADGFERSFLSVNRQLPGPTIQVCEGDKVVVDVTNKMEGLEVTIHWHGLFQKGSQYYDGVPLVTQCPINHGHTFRYQYYADNEGTHFWHSHDGMHKMDGVHGSLIVRVPRSEDPNSRLYDHDLAEHVVMLVDWTHNLIADNFPGLLVRDPTQLPDTFLINGRGNYTDPNTGITTNAALAVFNVESGSRYRFRFINSFCSTCIGELSIEGHTPILIATDGVPVQPVKVNTINSFAGERFDLVINANQSPGCYHILLRGLGACGDDKVTQLAYICYKGGPGQPATVAPTFDAPLPRGIVLGPLDGICNDTRDGNICISELRSARPVDNRIIHGSPDFRFYFDLNFYVFQLQQLFAPDTYETFFVPGTASGSIPIRSLVNNISFGYPLSPPISQSQDQSSTQFCDAENVPDDCGEPCTCTQLYRIPLNSMVELVLIDAMGVPGLSHPIHVHGYAFNVIGMGKHPDEKVKRMRRKQARELDEQHGIHRNLDLPPFKDTIAIPTGGYAVARFIANNPGYWLVHCHFLFHQLTGMELLMQVGEEDDVPPVPEGFPTCGLFLPPITNITCDAW